jgi:hypothetical protein
MVSQNDDAKAISLRSAAEFLAFFCGYSVLPGARRDRLVEPSLTVNVLVID